MRLKLGGQLTFVEFWRRLYAEYEKDAVSDTAAQLSYYLLFSLFPFLFFLLALAAYLPIGEAMDQMLFRMRLLVPGPAMALIDTNVRELQSQSRPKMLALALAGAIWSASRGVDAVRRALNLAYDVTESRPWWRTELASIATTLIGAGLMVVAAALLIVGGKVGLWTSDLLGVQSQFVWVMSWLRWPLTAFMVMGVAALAYYFLPDVEQEFKFITPGSVMGVLTWLGTTWGFGRYVSSFGNYNVTYGSLGGVIILMTWLYLSGFIFLIGGEVNAILEHASADGKSAGARTKDEAPAPPEERPSAMPPGAAKKAEVAEEAKTETKGEPQDGPSKAAAAHKPAPA